MSGPKVVRVVTREEVIDICRGELAKLDAALHEWTRVGQRNDCLSEIEIIASKKRRDAIASLLSAERHLDLQKQTTQEISFLRADLSRRLDEVAAAQAAARSVQRRQKEGERALLASLDKAGTPVPAELRRALLQGADSAAVSQAWNLLSASQVSDRSEQQALAAQYGEGLERRSFAEWLGARTSVEADPALLALDRKIAELRLLASGDAENFEQRLANLEAQETARRSLLIDSLNLDLSRALEVARSQQKLGVDLALVIAELTVFEPTLATAIQEKAEAAASASNAVTALIAEANEALSAARAHHAAMQRRDAVLSNLAALGYEVTEGMSTAWVENGRLVIRNVMRPDYGVEIGGDFSNERIQVRAVAFADDNTLPDASRDRDAETLWCSDVAVLSDNLAKAGSDLKIERALPVGATPLKRVADPGGADHRRSREGISQPAKTLNAS